MKVATFLLLFSINSYAGLGWFLLGAASSSGSKPESTKSELQLVLSSLEQIVPTLCNSALTIYAKCWNQFTQPIQTVTVSSSKIDDVHSYFSNKGYKVKKEKESLTFDFSEQHEKYLLHQSVPISLEGTLGLSFLLIVAGLLSLLRYKRIKYVREVKLIYEKNKGKLFFFDKSDKEKFEKLLLADSLPHWTIIIKDGEIKRIICYTGSSIRAIAAHEDSFILFKGSFKEKLKTRLVQKKPDK